MQNVLRSQNVVLTGTLVPQGLYRVDMPGDVAQNVVLTGTLVPQGLYWVDMPGDVAHVATHKMSKLEMLHIQLGHLNYQDIQKLIQLGLLDGI